MTGELPLFVLIHSPLVGPITWGLVAEQLRQRNTDAVVPSLCVEPARVPYWQRHASAVVDALNGMRVDRPVVLVAHSGAGPLLPVMGQGIRRAVGGYLFVDAALPGKDGQSRLDLFDAAEARRFREAAVDGLIASVWHNHDVLRAAGIAGPDLRERFVAEVPDVPLAVYEEPLPVPVAWPDAPCGYLRFSAAYEPEASAARRRGWAVRELAGGHFHMLADPPAVADALLALVAQMRIAL
jgi:hypothetical protein